ncbi:unnamed protein product, partial [Owenia fusiformis]
NSRPWSGNNKVVPYRFAAGFRADWQPKVRAAINEWQQKTCLTFRPAYPGDQHVIEFYHGTGCNSPVGMNRVNRISLEYPGCGSHYTILHEIGHSLGMGHEHQHPDQAQYMTILYQNIEEKWKQWYRPMPRSNVDTKGFSYDPYSVMHYHPGPSNRPFIKMRDPRLQSIVGQVKSLSAGDANFVNKGNGCQGTGGGTGPRITTPRPRVTTPRPRVTTQRPVTGACNGAMGRQSGNGQQVTQNWINKTWRQVRLMWVDYNGNTNGGWLIQPLQSTGLMTNTQHPFVARIEGGQWLKINGQCVHYPNGGYASIDF